MGKVLDVQCPSCSAPLHFDAKLGKMKCDYCDSVFDVNELKNVDNVTVMESTEENKSEENYVKYNCPDCGAEIIADETTSATFCLYCGNTAILKNKLSGKFAPDKIIPFKTEKEDAINAFKGLCKGRIFMPKFFNSEKNIEKITGLYIPFWLYEVDVDGSIDATGIKVTSWSNGNTHYTKQDFYDINRTGNMNFKRIPVDGSTRFANDIMNTLEPFYFHYLVDYNHAYLSGYLAENYDVSFEEAFKDAEARSLETTKNVMLNDMGNYATKTIKSNSLKSEMKSYEYALLPVWMLNVKYKDKYYLFAMNGQTGEFVGDVPIDKKKVVWFSIALFVICFAIFMLISFLIYLGGRI